LRDFCLLLFLLILFVFSAASCFDELNSCYSEDTTLDQIHADVVGLQRQCRRRDIRRLSTLGDITWCVVSFNPLTPTVAIWVQLYYKASCARPG